MKTVGVRFRRAGKIYAFDPGQLELRRNMKVIVESANGTEIGSVVYTDRDVSDEAELANVKKVLRIATEADLEKDGKNRAKEASAFEICKKKIADRNLAMRLVAAEYTFDNNKLLFYFTADSRIDFRELVKDLASIFHTRIELRQIGVRDETKMLGGLGVCGRPLCCSSYLSEFQSVTIRMAKDQGLSLSPTKISGMCGRLMCCLKNEQDTYEYLNSRLPSVGDAVVIKNGEIKATVKSVNVLRQTVEVLITGDDDTDVRVLPVEELRISGHHKKGGKPRFSNEEMQEMKELEALEKSDKGSRLD